MKTVFCNVSLNRLKCYCNVTVTHICVITLFMNHSHNFVFVVIFLSNMYHDCHVLTAQFFLKCIFHLLFMYAVSGRSSAYGDTAVEGHPAGPGSISSSTGAISTTTAQQEGEGSDGEGETEGDIHTSNRSDKTKCEELD